MLVLQESNQKEFMHSKEQSEVWLNDQREVNFS